MTVAVKERRYDRDRWLQTALDVLASEGGARLRVEAIAKALNVTKGSFYHHFRDRSDFVGKVSEYWADKYTQSVISEVGEAEGDGRERLAAVFRLVARRGLNKYDIAFRSWAAQDPDVAEVVRRVDEARYAYVRQQFEDMGFTGIDLEIRVRTLLSFASAAGSVTFPADVDDKTPDLLDILDFTLRP